MSYVFWLCLVILLIGFSGGGVLSVVAASFVVLMTFLTFNYFNNRIHSLEEKIDSLLPKITKEKNKVERLRIVPKDIEKIPLTDEEKVEIPVAIREGEKAEDTNNIFSDFDSAIENKIKSLFHYLLKGNPIAKIGVVILFIGIAFLLKFASAYIHFSIEARLSAVAIVGILMLVLGYRLNKNNPIFGQILEGGGIAILFLTTYAAFRVFDVLPAVLAFSLLVVLVIVSCLISVVQNSKSLAVFGILGGYLSPLLISTGEGNVVILFSYYAVLNTFILIMAWFKSWPGLNLIGFTFTYLISGLWGWHSYQPTNFNVCEFFLSLFFLQYFFIGVLYAAYQVTDMRYRMDSIITLGTPFITYSLQAQLVDNAHYGLAFTTIMMCVFYAIAGMIITLTRKKSMQFLGKVFGGLSLLFGTLAISLVLTDNWTAIAWTLESLAIMYVGVKFRKRLLRYAAAFLQFFCAYIFYQGFLEQSHYLFFADYLYHFYLTGAAIGLSGIICGSFWFNCKEPCSLNENFFAIILLIWGAIWWYGSAINSISLNTAITNSMAVITLFFASSSVAFWVFNAVLDWRLLRYLALLILPIMILTLFNFIITYPPLSNLTLLMWVVSFVVLYGILTLHEKDPAYYLPSCHIFSLLLLNAVIAFEIGRYIDFHLHWPFTWVFVLYGFVPVLTLLSISSNLSIGEKSIYKKYYQHDVGQILSGWLLLWFLASSFFSGNVSPLHFIPIFNPLDLTVMFVILSLIYWYDSIARHSALFSAVEKENFPMILLIAMLFVWLNVVLLRGCHHYAHIPYAFDDLWASSIVQTAFSIFWTTLSLVATFVASRIQSRTLWFAGLLLIAIVVIKLFVIDLSNIGTLERIITFITVGVLLLINGYISPMPPKQIK